MFSQNGRSLINAHLVAELYCIAYASFCIIYLYLKSIYDFLHYADFKNVGSIVMELYL